MGTVLTFLRRLDEAGLHYSLGSFRETGEFQVTTPANERWEVEFFGDGSVEVERFVSTGVRDADPARLEDLFRD